MNLWFITPELFMAIGTEAPNATDPASNSQELRAITLRKVVTPG